MNGARVSREAEVQWLTREVSARLATVTGHSIDEWRQYEAAFFASALLDYFEPQRIAEELREFTYIVGDVPTNGICVNIVSGGPCIMVAISLDRFGRVFHWAARPQVGVPFPEIFVLLHALGKDAQYENLLNAQGHVISSAQAKAALSAVIHRSGRIPLRG